MFPPGLVPVEREHCAHDTMAGSVPWAVLNSQLGHIALQCFAGLGVLAPFPGSQRAKQMVTKTEGSRLS